MKKAVRASSESVNFRTVKSSGAVSEDLPLLFSFSSFRAEAISIKRFNNHYRDIDEYVRKMSILFRFGLPLLSREEVCPVNEANLCKRMDYLHTCFMFDFLDEKKYRETYGYKVDYDKAGKQ